MNSGGSHVSEDKLLRHLDGELNRKEGQTVSAHLAACWTCRDRSERLKEAISDFIRFRDQMVGEPPRASSTARARLLYRLEYLERHEQRPSRIAGLFTLLRVRSSVRIGMIGLAILTMAIWFRRTPVVSAAELLARAEVSRMETFRANPSATIEQRLIVRAGRRSLLRTISAGQTARVFSAEELQFKSDFERASVDWNDPLSPAGFRGWLSTAGRGTEQVRLSALPDGSPAYTIVVRPSGRALQYATYVVRARDWHPVRRSFRLRGSNTAEYECEEIGFRLVPRIAMPGLKARVPESLGTASAVEAHVAATAPPAPASLTAASMAEEVNALFRLHRAGACLGEPLELVRQRGTLILSGQVEDADRRRQLVAAMSGTNVKVDIQTFGEAAAQVVAGVPPAGHERLEAPGVTPLRQALEDHFGSTMDRVRAHAAAANASDAALGTSRDLLAHAWALRRLSERLPESALLNLRDNERLQLESMANDHLREVERTSARLSSATRILVDVAQGTALSAGGARPGIENAEFNWPAVALEIFTAVERCDRLLWRLLVESDRTSVPAADAVELQHRLAALEERFRSTGPVLRITLPEVVSVPPKKDF